MATEDKLATALKEALDTSKKCRGCIICGRSDSDDATKRRVGALESEVKELKAQLKALTECDFCGGELSGALCNVCDNDE